MEQGTATHTAGEGQEVVFSPEQQAKVQTIIDGHTARLRAEQDRLKQTLESSLAEIRRENEELKGRVKQSAEPKGDTPPEVEELKRVAADTNRKVEEMAKQLQEKDSVIAQTKAETLKVRMDAAIMSAAGKVGFVDVGDVVQLTRGSVKWDEGRQTFVVVNDQGVERLNSSYNPMTLEEFYMEYANKKPHLVRSDIKGGAGSAESLPTGARGTDIKRIFGKESSAKEALELKRKDPAEYKRLKQDAVKMGLI